MNETLKTTKRDIILDVAIDLFLQHGYDGTGIEQIILTAETSRGGLYHHFKSKDALHYAVLNHLFLAPMQSMSFHNFAKMPLKQQQGLLVDLFRSMPQTMDAMTRHGVSRYFAFYFDSLSRVPEFRATVSAYYQQLLGILQTSISAERHLTEDDARKQARAFLARLEGEIYLCAVLGDKPDLTKLSREMDV